MKIRLLAFGMAQDIVGTRRVELALEDSVTTAGGLKTTLTDRYPALAKVSFLLAVNSEYAHDDTVIKAADEVAIIPPTSGG